MFFISVIRSSPPVCKFSLTLTWVSAGAGSIRGPPRKRALDATFFLLLAATSTCAVIEGDGERERTEVTDGDGEREALIKHLPRDASRCLLTWAERSSQRRMSS